MTTEGDKESELFMEKELLIPYKHIVSEGSGKQYRLKILMSFNHWMKLPTEKALSIAKAVHMIHVGTLLIDDVQDNTLVRRSVPTAHVLYGIPTTINAGLQTITLAFKKLLSFENPMIGQYYCDFFLEIVRGQGKEIYWRDNFQCPTEEQYEHMLEQKTGNLFKLYVYVMKLFSLNKTDYSDLAVAMGLYFQLKDDYWNLANTEALEEWPSTPVEDAMKSQYYCEDLTEGKFTLPIIHAAKQKGGEAVLDILREHTKDISVKKYCLSLLEELGSMQYTRDRLRRLECSIRDQIHKFGGNPDLLSVLDEMASAI